jgi:tRNA (guanine37-N1)-methyltransferase
MNRINIITLFPELFTPFLTVIPFKNIIGKSAQLNVVNLREFGLGNYKKVDETPYGGGPGMVLMVEPIFNALKSLNDPASHKILLSPRGKVFTQAKAHELTTKGSITLICGRYEGIDARIEEICNETLSLGSFVLSGGEAAAISVLEATLRLLPDGIGSNESLQIESFTKEGVIEYPQYTRPEEFENLKVPEVLLSGNHKEIEKWRLENSTLKED